MLMIIFFVHQNLKNLPLSKILDIEKINNVDKPIETDTAIGKNEIIKAIKTVFRSCWPTNIRATIGTTVALGIALKPTRRG